MHDPAVLIAIVNYRTPALAIEALRSIIADLDGQRRRAIIVDNGSADGSAEMIGRAIVAEKWQDRVSLTAGELNRGFGAGNNMAVAAARREGFAPDLIWLLNPDAYAAPGTLPKVIDFFTTHERAGIVGTRIQTPDGLIDRSAFRFPTPTGEMESVLGFAFVTTWLRRHVIAPAAPETACRVDWLSGASLAIRAPLYEKLGGFDEGFFLYYEETDLCRRAAALGAECWYDPAGSVTHLIGQSSGATDDARNRLRRPRCWFESRARYYRRNQGRFALLAANIGWLAAYPIGRIAARMRGRASRQPPKLWLDMLRFGFSAAKNRDRASTGA